MSFVHVLLLSVSRFSHRVQYNQSYLDEVNTLPDTCVEPQPTRSDCSNDLCYHLLYRTMDGSCNNFRSPSWGAAYTELRRLRRPAYDDDVMMPIGQFRLLPKYAQPQLGSDLYTELRRLRRPAYDDDAMMPIGTVDRKRRPSARDASRLLLSVEKEVYDDRYNELIMLWGQFVAHDISKTSKVAFNQSCLFCFPPDGSHCIAMKVPLGDPDSREFGCHFSSHPSVTAIEFLPKLICCIISTRSSPVCDTGETRATPREQYNENTAFIDASMVYGSSLSDLKKLRNSNTPFMKVSSVNGREYMPYNKSKEMCNSTKCTYQFFAGDPRNDLFIGLSALQTIFVREHNRIARSLQKLNRHWNNERVFQETRKILGAIVQVITYEEYLPVILGKREFDRKVGRYYRYNSNQDPSIFNVFATSTLRFGHGMILSHFPRFENDGYEYRDRGYSVLDAVFNGTRLVDEGGVDVFLNGMMHSKAKKPKGVAKQLTRRLFGNTDLTAINIERGREHGLPGYNTWRKYCRLRDARTFADLSREIPSAQTRLTMELLYFKPENVDLYVGQLLEEAIPGGMVGPTIACILAEQFKALRDGDRLYYENPGVFLDEQILELKKASLPRLFCDNGDGMSRVPKTSFGFAPFNDFVKCDDIPLIDLNKWKE